MKLKKMLSLAAVLCLGASVALAADNNQQKQDTQKTTAMDQLRNIQKNSKDAAKDANAGNLGSAKAKACQGWGTCGGR